MPEKPTASRLHAERRDLTNTTVARWSLFDAIRLSAPPGPGPYGQMALFVVIVAVWILAGFIGIRSQRRQSAIEPFQLARGVLMDAVKKLARKAKIFVWLDPRVYVLPDQDFAEACARVRSGVIVPRRLLDSLSRRELYALVTRQLCLQSKQYFYPAFWTLLVFDVAAAELGVLSIYLPHAIFQADLRALDLTGEPEVFLSALGGLSCYSGTPLPQMPLREIARRKSLSPDRIASLFVEHPSPEEHRYPTTGSYLTTGL
jgi:Zn-dependent protease with chaperone function